MSDREAEKYEEYKRIIQNEGPARLRALLESGKIAATAKVNALRRALREYEERQEHERITRQEERENRALEIAQEANNIARKAALPVWLQAVIAVLALIVVSIGVYLDWMGTALDFFRTLIGK